MKLGLSIIVVAAVCAVIVITIRHGGDRARYDLEPFRRSYEIPFNFPEKYNGIKREKLIEVGGKLFFDPRLSKNGLMSCATCHNPSFHWTDGLKASVENASKRSMSLYNVGWDRSFLWNGHAGSVTAQAFLPLTAPTGMNGDPYLIWQRLSGISYYRNIFDQIYGDERTDTINIFTVAQALDFYIATIISPRAPFDDWVDGDDRALTPEQKKGFELFTGKANCSKCHKTWRFSESQTHDIGRKFAGESLANAFQSDPFFKTVGLRNIADRPPYMHDGSFATLEEVVNFYNKGGEVDRPTKSPLIKPLNLSDEEQRSIVSFLKSLSGVPEPVPFPILPR